MKKNLPLATIRMLLIDLTAAIALISEGAIVPRQAGDDPGDLINYSFTLWIGSGVFKVKSADKRFAVLRARLPTHCALPSMIRRHSAINLNCGCSCRH